MLSKYYQAQYQLSLKMNKEKGGRRRVRNLLPYEEACWQPTPVPCILNVPAQIESQPGSHMGDTLSLPSF